MLHALTVCQQALDNGLYVGVIIVDIRKAFDTVQFQLLVDELAAVGIKSKALSWFCNYLYGRENRVVMGSSTSAAFVPLTGVPQGSCLGPKLFTLSTRHAVTELGDDGNAFADDICFWKMAPSPQEAVDALLLGLEALQARLQAKHLMVSTPKSALMVLLPCGNAKHDSALAMANANYPAITNDT